MQPRFRIAPRGFFLKYAWEIVPPILFTAAFAFVGACITVGEPPRMAFQRTTEVGADAQSRPVIRPYPNSGADAQVDWPRVLAQKAKIRFEILHTGRVRVPRSGMLNLDHEKLQGQSDSEIFVDVFAFHLCHVSRGCWLIDSGLDASYRENIPGGNVSGLMADSFIKGSEQQAGQDIAAQLQSRTESAGAKRRDAKQEIQGVFFTHLHGDHTSGVPALPKNIRYIAGKDETYINYYLLYHSDHLAGVRSLEEIDFTHAKEQAPLGRVVDLFSDGSFWAISTPGHSSGHVSYLVMTTDGPVLLTGDASHTRWGFENGVEPGWTWNRAKMQESLQQLRNFAQRYPKVRVIFGHEL